MKPNERSTNVLSVTRSKAKMFEYSVPLDDHINIVRDPADLFSLTIGLLGDAAAELNRGEFQNETQTNLRFSALFFDSYIQAKLDSDLDAELFLLGAAAYYICDLPGNASVLIGRLDHSGFSNSLASFLCWIIKSNFDRIPSFTEGKFSSQLVEIAELANGFFENGDEIDRIGDLLLGLRESAYSHGTSWDVLIADLIAACMNLKIRNSVRTLLPLYSEVAPEVWETVFKKSTFVRELWPSQRLLGAGGIFKGQSAVVQMPTSAGKSKSIEIIVRSAFASGRARTCVVVAPFRALCHEISETLKSAFKGENIFVNELSDIFQNDFDTQSLVENEQFQILSVTPEKLVYVLRQSPELAGQIGLLILDEGHQFDSGTRGVTYELLITSLKSLLPASVQTVLISAVISNAESIAQWLLGEGAKVIKDSSLAPTFKTVGFSSWTTNQGRIQYVQSDDITKDDFWVPRVLESQILKLRGRERSIRNFPEKTDGVSIAAHLAIKLSKNGGVAVFCGSKRTAPKLIQCVVDAFSRGYSQEMPSRFSNSQELGCFIKMYEENFGQTSCEKFGAELGILSHHASIPQGIRMATEFALRKGDVKFIVCTSTLAQGVNLPIRYLIFTSIYQAGERIRTRDFHNLIGRTGRSGLQTEGTILFADPEVFDKKRDRNERWRFNSIKNLFDVAQSEPCASSLLELLTPFKDEEGNDIDEVNILGLLTNYFNNEASLETLVSSISDDQNSIDESKFRAQVRQKLKIASSIEGHLISALQGISGDDRLTFCSNLAEKTLAYHLADDLKKSALKEVFKLICQNTDTKVTSDAKKAIYSRTLLGVQELLEIDDWINDNLGLIAFSSDSEDELFNLLFPVLERYLVEGSLTKLTPGHGRLDVALGWISGVSFINILSSLQESGARTIAGTQMRKIDVYQIVEACEGQLAFEGMLILGAIAEVLEANSEFTDTTIPDMVRTLQKRIKYGLASELEIQIYEAGFNDRILAQKLASKIAIASPRNRFMLKRSLVEMETEVRAILADYPSYYREVFNSIVA